MAAGSGIMPSNETLALVDELRKNNSKYAFGLFKVEGVQVVPDSVYPTNEDDIKELASLKAGGDASYAADFKTKVWPKFVSAIEAANAPRFAVIDFAYVKPDGRNIRQLVSISYCSDRGTTAKVKMTFASTKTAFETRINIGKKYSANDLSDLEFDTVFEAIKN